MEVKEKLNRLFDYKCQRDMLELKKKEQIESLIPAEIKQQIQDLELEFASKAEAVDSNIKELEEEIKAYVVKNKIEDTVKGEHLMVFMNEGRATWDDKQLLGLCKAMPDLKDLRKVGKPYATIKII